MTEQELLDLIDGAIVAHGEAVRSDFDDFLTLGRRIADRCGAVLR